MAEIGEVELSPPPLPPHLRNQILWGYPPPPFLCPVGSTMGFSSLFPQPHCFIVGEVCHPLCHILG
jgi:hypothetical protein